MKFRTQAARLLALAALLVSSAGLRAQQATPDQIFVDASAPIAPPQTGYLQMGGTSTDGHSLQVNSRYLTLDGKPWLPVMGEFHYSRYPASQWEDEILKMQAAGVNIVSTYIFWIHHEEVQGQFDWSGQRDLRRFVQLCAKHHMYVWLRVGPWAHGEVRNGGFPDWIAKLPNLRSNDPTYLHFVTLFYDQIGKQVQGLMFKDGGPVIGTQIENEYSLHGPGRGAEHISRLKQLAMAAGIDTPLYTVTGWPSLDFPPREVIPVYGGYPDGFWSGSQTNDPPAMNYLFNFNRELGDMGATVPTEDPTGKVDLDHYPFLAAEKAGGMATSYHRRPVMSADDITALTYTGVGSGINLYGYYMFHGGANPKGLLTTLQESTATGYPNDLPEVTYDFQAPLGEFGQERESYRKTRLLHLFLNSFGSQLAPMPAFAPAGHTRDAANTTEPRVAVRTDGNAGFVFVNNYVRQLAMPAHPGFQTHIKLAAGEITLPAHTVTIPAGSYFVWPFNLKLGRLKLTYATAQLLTQLETPAGRLVVFFAIPGIAPELSFDPATVGSGQATLHPTPGRNASFQLTDKSGARTTFLVLTEAEAEHAAILHLGAADHLALTASDVFYDGQSIHLRSASGPTQTLSLYPDATLGRAGKRNGLFTDYTLTQPEQHPELTVTQTQTATPRAAMEPGLYVDWRKRAVPGVPPISAFDQAAVWRLQWQNANFAGLSNMLLQVDYTGDIARLASPTTLLDDNFYNGLPWEIGLKRFGPLTAAAPLLLKILPMPKVAPIYLDPRARTLLEQQAVNPGLIRARLIPEYESTLPVSR
jgi:beta-galactosidase